MSTNRFSSWTYLFMSKIAKYFNLASGKFWVDKNYYNSCFVFWILFLINEMGYLFNMNYMPR